MEIIQLQNVNKWYGKFHVLKDIDFNVKEKLCRGCKLIKSIDNFNKAPMENDGWSGNCRDCKRERSTRLKNRDPERFKLKRRNTYLIRREVPKSLASSMITQILSEPAQHLPAAVARLGINLMAARLTFLALRSWGLPISGTISGGRSPFRSVWPTPTHPPSLTTALLAAIAPGGLSRRAMKCLSSLSIKSILVLGWQRTSGAWKLTSTT